jgi:hypothetical protein
MDNIQEIRHIGILKNIQYIMFVFKKRMHGYYYPYLSTLQQTGSTPDNVCGRRGRVDFRRLLEYKLVITLSILN